MKEVRSKDFDKEVLQARGVVLVHFYVKWNGACHMNASMIKEATDQMQDQLKVCQIDIEKHPKVAELYGVSQIPTFIVFRDGKVIEHVNGLLTRSIFQQKIFKILNINSDETSSKI